MKCRAMKCRRTVQMQQLGYIRSKWNKNTLTSFLQEQLIAQLYHFARFYT